MPIIGRCQKFAPRNGNNSPIALMIVSSHVESKQSELRGVDDDWEPIFLPTNTLMERYFFTAGHTAPQTP